MRKGGNQSHLQQASRPWECQWSGRRMRTLGSESAFISGFIPFSILQVSGLWIPCPLFCVPGVCRGVGSEQVGHLLLSAWAASGQE